MRQFFRAMSRKEFDSFGEILVENSKLWGAQTQRSLQNFKIGKITLPGEMVRSLVIVKKACATVNMRENRIPKDIGKGIVFAADRILADGMQSQFPLVIFQTGSGTQSNMNVNEVISNIANEHLGHERGSKHCHPNDHVNHAQSSNDTFPTAMHISALSSLENLLIPALKKMCASLENKVREFQGICKIGRTHLQDATPLTLGNEFSAYQTSVRNSLDRIESGKKELYQLAQGGSAVGTGLNTPSGFDCKVAEEIARITGMPFVAADNKFEQLSTHDSLVSVHGILNTLSVSLMKIANDIRFLASGPRCGLGELILPSLEPGSSIMPGKVNPTQAEALTMVAAKVMGNHTTMTVGGLGGHFQLNCYKPLMIYTFLESVELLSDGCRSFTENCLNGIFANQERIKENLNRSLMLVTALNPHVGYDNAARIAKKAHEENTTLREAALELGLLSAEKFDEVVVAEKMV